MKCGNEERLVKITAQENTNVSFSVGIAERTACKDSGGLEDPRAPPVAFIVSTERNQGEISEQR